MPLPTVQTWSCCWARRSAMLNTTRRAGWASEAVQLSDTREVGRSLRPLSDCTPNLICFVRRSIPRRTANCFGTLWGSQVLKGQEVKAASRYEDDVLINNHTAVWGSWWKDGQWGYACCHQTVKNSYCIGKAGEEAAAQSAMQLQV
jgi:Pre-mRNA splicing Prp18-interacting factor